MILLNQHLGSGVAPPAWDPTMLANIAGWWKASHLVLSDNDPIGSWPDGNGVHTATASGSDRPTYKANASDPYADFSGLNVIDTHMPTTWSQSFSIVAVMEVAAAMAPGARFCDCVYNTGFWCGGGFGAGTGNLGGGIREGSPPYGYFPQVAPNNAKFVLIFEREWFSAFSADHHVWINGGHHTNPGVDANSLFGADLVVGGDRSGVPSGIFGLYELIATSGPVIAGGVLDSDLDAYLTGQGLTV